MTDATKNDVTVAVPRWAIEFLLENGAPFWDAGPVGEGWPSPGMERAIRALEDALWPVPKS